MNLKVYKKLKKKLDLMPAILAPGIKLIFSDTKLTL